MLALGHPRAASAAARTPIRARNGALFATTTTTSRPLRLARAAAQQQQKGFGGSGAPSTSPSDPSTSSSNGAAATSTGRRDDDAALERLEARLKSRRQAAAKLEPKVKVESAAVKLGTGQAPTEAGGAAETLFVQFLGALFVLILVEGLVLAASVCRLVSFFLSGFGRSLSSFRRRVSL
jgi:hypothetical protein